jgi:hypothetical protein
MSLILIRQISGSDELARRDWVTEQIASGSTTHSGWVVVNDITISGSGVASDKVYDDSPSNTVIQSCTISGLSINALVKASYPNVIVGGVSKVLSRDVSGGHYSGSVAVAVSGTCDLIAQTVTPDGELGAFDTVALTYDAPPTILTLEFTGSYPGSQTELKAGDTFQVHGTTDVATNGVQVQDYEAGISQDIACTLSTEFTVTITIADRGTSVQSLVARMKAKNAAGAYGATADTSNTVDCNNMYPTATWGSKTYPSLQSAIKDSETCSVAITLANLDTVSFTSPNSDLSITNPSTIETPKIATRIAGSYNISTTNLRATANRAANDATTVSDTVVKIANVAPTISVTTPATRLRSGGNDGTSQQSHTITITSNQQLLQAPSMSEESGGGSFTGAWTGGPSVYTRTLNVHDDHVKGTYTFNSLTATGLAGIEQNTIGSGADYVLGGFVQRNLTFSAFSQSTALNVEVVTYSKLTAGIFTATNQSALRNASQGDHSDIVNTYTVDDLSTNPTTIWWNDVTAAGTNSTGTAQITLVEETV